MPAHHKAHRVQQAHQAASQRRQRVGAPPHALAHHRRGIGQRFERFRQAGAGAFAAFLAVLGPGLLAGLSDDDPAGITTYSVLGADFGYRLLWIVPASTLLLVQFHLLAVRIGAVTGLGFVGAIRLRWGKLVGYLAVLGLLFANFGTICAEYAGIAAAGSLIGVPNWLSTPIAAVLISLLVVLGSFHRVERVLLLISSTLALYIIDGILAAPDWGLVWHHSLVPHLPDSPAGWVVIAATLGTTLAPWGLAFIQSYAVDKKISVAQLRWERVDVVIGSVLTGVIGLAIAVACAATLHRAGVHIQDARDAAAALQPLAVQFATVLFGAGLLGASLLAAAIVPLATAYSIAEGVGAPASLDLDSRHFQWFYAAFVGLTVAAAAVVSLPGLPLIPLIYSSQVVNAVLLPLHVIALQLLARDVRVMGEARSGRWAAMAGWVSVALIIACVAALAASEAGLLR
ncbi:NRAMP family divalent metal transporter [Paucibacter sp. Y2R2-4]|uniref:NRAMP family divalent metal transporter n=1 Tax=Paucibacter sp. Y2R2-4 TaxID=2893553 RepID=UPI0021E3D72E|nr:divalent metal cation transporter [Paucibacter sp. Y2R2-4]MCV2352473.1 divalent metal cation transporter [Paucibacter sp. Y2R2-4]